VRSSGDCGVHAVLEVWRGCFFLVLGGYVARCMGAW